MKPNRIRKLEQEIELLAHKQPRRKTLEDQQEGMREIIRKYVDYFRETKEVEGVGRVYRPHFRWSNGYGRKI